MSALGAENSLIKIKNDPAKGIKSLEKKIKELEKAIVNKGATA